MDDNADTPRDRDRAPTPQRTAHTVRMGDPLWAEFGLVAAACGEDRSEALRRMVANYVRHGCRS
jgi:hypothetical protein